MRLSTRWVLPLAAVLALCVLAALSEASSLNGDLSPSLLEVQSTPKAPRKPHKPKRGGGGMCRDST